MATILGASAVFSLRRRTGGYWQRAKQHGLLVNAAIYVSGNFLQKALAFLLFPLWAHFLSVEDYGITGNLAAYSGLLSTFLIMGLHGAAVRHYFDYVESPDLQKKYISSIIAFQIILPGIVILILNLFGAELWQHYTKSTIPFDPYVRIMLWSTYISSVAQIPLSLYEAQQKAKELVSIQYGTFLIGIITTIILVAFLHLGAYGVLLGQLISSIAISIVVLRKAISNWFTQHIEWTYVESGLSFGLPLVPHLIAGWLIDIADRIILERFVSIREIGLYNVGYTFGMAMQFLVSGINQAWSPYYYRLMETGSNQEYQIIKTVSMYITMIGGICLFGIMFASDFIYILLPQEYYSAIVYIGPVLLGYLLSGFYYFAVAPIFFYRKTKILPLITVLAAISNIILNIYLIPLYGAIASAWITTFTNGMLFVLVYLVSKKYQKIHYPLRKYSMPFILILSITIIGEHLRTINFSILLIKTGLLICYALITFLLLLTPYQSGDLSKPQT